MAATAKKKFSVTMAEKADIHDLYEQSVQAVDVEAEFLRDTYRALRGREAVSSARGLLRHGESRLRVGAHGSAPARDRRGSRRRRARLGAAQSCRAVAGDGACTRSSCLNDDVRTVSTERVDIVGAFNFSYFCFKAREEMRDYFARVHEALNRDGVFFLDAFGGPDASDLTKEKTKIDGFTYVWEQAEFEPVTSRILCHIHFKFPDGSKIKRAFTYDWRLWTLPELRELPDRSGLLAGSRVLGRGRRRRRRQRRVQGARDRRGRPGVDRLSRRREMSDRCSRVVAALRIVELAPIGPADPGV